MATQMLIALADRLSAFSFWLPPSPPLRGAGARRSSCFSRTPALYKHTSLGPAEKAVIELGKTGGFEVTTVEGYKQDSKQLDFSFLTPEYLESVRRRDDDDQRQPADSPTRRKRPCSISCAAARASSARTARRSPSTTIRNSARCSAAISIATCRKGTIAVLKVEDGKHPATKMLGAGWPLVDEFYLFGTAPWDAARPDDNIDVLFKNKIPMGFSRDRVHVLLSLDTERMDMSKQPNLKRGGDYPQAWTREYGKGRSFYTSLGHRDDIWSERSGVSSSHQRRHSMGARARAVASRGLRACGLRACGPRASVPRLRIASTGVSSSASQLRQSRSGDRVLLESVSLDIEGHVRRTAGVAIAEQRVGAVQQGRRAAGDAAANRVLAFRVARHRRARDARSLSETERHAACRSTPATARARARYSSAATRIRDGGVLGLTRAQASRRRRRRA